MSTQVQNPVQIADPTLKTAKIVNSRSRERREERGVETLANKGKNTHLVAKGKLLFGGGLLKFLIVVVLFRLGLEISEHEEPSQGCREKDEQNSQWAHLSLLSSLSVQRFG